MGQVWLEHTSKDFQSLALTISATAPLYRSLPICHNDFIMKLLIEKSLLKLFEAGVGVKPTYQDFADPDLNRSDTQPNI